MPILILSSQEQRRFPPEQLTELRTRIEDVATLHEIGIIDLRSVGERFKQEVVRQGIRL